MISEPVIQKEHLAEVIGSLIEGFCCILAEQHV